MQGVDRDRIEVVESRIGSNLCRYDGITAGLRHHRSYCSQATHTRTGGICLDGVRIFGGNRNLALAADLRSQIACKRCIRPLAEVRDGNCGTNAYRASRAGIGVHHHAIGGRAECTRSRLHANVVGLDGIGRERGLGDAGHAGVGHRTTHAHAHTQAGSTGTVHRHESGVGGHVDRIGLDAAASDLRTDGIGLAAERRQATPG